MTHMKKSERSIGGVDSDLLRTFLAVADQQSVSRASRQIGRTQSAVSVQVRKLEEALQVRLFERQARGVALTDSGTLLLPAARRAIAEIDGIRDLFAEPLAGRIRIGIPDDYGTDVLERILAGFTTRHERVEVSMRFGNSSAYPDALARGDLDLAVYAAEGRADDRNRLFLEQTVWAARDDWTLPRGHPVPLALFDQACWWRDAAMTALSEAGISYRVAVTSESVAGVKAAIRTGLAVAMIAETALEPGMRVLDGRMSFPGLPSSSLVLGRSSGADSDAVTAMETAIRDGFVGLKG
ncbi:LysR substrate-binding domain-containing protein [Microbaculum marinum]|uniref:LysR substrate-binding domain-containing protein n=1 Tax=Microbaculum marinum TaxID=1764581 RepID=A0AAW9RVU7_9HYPH